MTRIRPLYTLAVSTHMLGGVGGGGEVCGRILKPSRQLQDHKTLHCKIPLFEYLPTLAVHLSLLGMEVSMCNLSIV